MGIIVTTPSSSSSKPKRNNTHVYPPLFVTDPVTQRKIYASPWEQRWEDMYDRLVQFVDQYGFANCNNQRGYSLDQRLSDWVQIQRENLRLGMVRRDRQLKLQAIGVTPLYVRE